MRSEEDPHTRALHELWSMILHTFRSPPFLIPVPSPSRPQISPASFGLLFIGISMALMFFGIVTFFIGFVLMPLVIMLLVLFYFVAIVSKVLETGRTILWPVSDYNKVWSYSS